LFCHIQLYVHAYLKIVNTCPLLPLTTGKKDDIIQGILPVNHHLFVTKEGFLKTFYMQFLKNINYKVAFLGLFNFLVLLEFAILLTLNLTETNPKLPPIQSNLVLGRVNFYLYFIYVLILAPIAEELIFRLGLVKNNYKLRLFSSLALLLVGIRELFKILHHKNYVYVFISGTFLQIPGVIEKPFIFLDGKWQFIENLLQLNIWPKTYIQIHTYNFIDVYFILIQSFVLVILYIIATLLSKKKLELKFINTKIFGIVYLLVSIVLFWLSHIGTKSAYFDIDSWPRYINILWLYPLFLNKGLRVAILGHSLTNLSVVLVEMIMYLNIVSKTDLYFLISIWFILLITFLNSYYKIRLFGRLKNLVFGS
jgi:hypothetical protein